MLASGSMCMALSSVVSSLTASAIVDALLLAATLEDGMSSGCGPVFQGSPVSYIISESILLDKRTICAKVKSTVWRIS